MLRVLRAVLAVGEHRVQDAAGAAGGDDADGLRVGGGVAVQHVERHRDDLGLELRLARAHVALERVHVGEATERLVHEAVVLVVAAVHRAGALARLPEGVFLLGHRRQLGEDLLAGPSLLGQRAVDGEAILVRVCGHRTRTLLMSCVENEESGYPGVSCSTTSAALATTFSA